MNYQLPKNERLHAEKSIKELFHEGSSFFFISVQSTVFCQKGRSSRNPKGLVFRFKKEVQKSC
jgi:ribonuclease P protein component